MDRFKHTRRFIDCFLILRGGITVSDNACSGLDIRFAVLEDAGAESDTAVEVAIKAEVADGSGVGATFAFFEAANDFHGAHLGGSADRAGGEGGAHDVVGAAVGAEFAADVGDDVHDVGVAFDDHEFVDVDGAELSCAADIVSGEVDEHDVLGAFFGVGEHFGGEGVVILGGGASPAGSCNGSDFDVAMEAFDVDFGAAADKRKALRELDAEHVGGRVDVAQGAEEIERSALVIGLESLGGHDLENVTGGDEFF